MLNKPLSFSLLAAAMLFAPTAAIADSQEQYTEQRIYQNGAAIDGSTTVQDAELRSTQEQTQIIREGRDRYYRRNRNDDRDRYYRRRVRDYDRDRDYRRDRDDDYYYYDR